MADLGVQQRTQKPGQRAAHPLTPPVPAAEGEVVPRPSQTASPAFSNGHQPIATAPKTGVAIKVFGNDMQRALAYWRATRAYNPRSLKWEAAAFWAIQHTSMKLDFEPRTWTPLKPTE